jgi:hypothetical protein
MLHKAHMNTLIQGQISPKYLVLCRLPETGAGVSKQRAGCLTNAALALDGARDSSNPPRSLKSHSSQYKQQVLLGLI